MSRYVHVLSLADRQRAVRMALAMVAGEIPDVAIGPTRHAVRLLAGAVACKLERGQACIAEVL